MLAMCTVSLCVSAVSCWPCVLCHCQLCHVGHVFCVTVSDVSCWPCVLCHCVCHVGHVFCVTVCHVGHVFCVTVCLCQFGHVFCVIMCSVCVCCVMFAVCSVSLLAVNTETVCAVECEVRSAAV